MNETLIIGLIAAGSALGGGIIGGIISVLTAKISADREDKRRREEIERKTAIERLNLLYDPLLKLIEPSPPYDEFYIDKEIQKWIIQEVEKHELHASPDLLRLFWGLRFAYYQHEKFDTEKQWKFLRLVQSEHNKLKEILGYGHILKTDSIGEKIIKIVKLKVDSLYDKYRKIRWKIRHRRKIKRKDTR